jgi:CBS domain-containing protein
MKVREVMHSNPVTLEAETKLLDAVEVMLNKDVGDVAVCEGGSGKVCGIVSDWEIATGVLSNDLDPAASTLDAICQRDQPAVSPDAETSEAEELMRQRSMRRLAVKEDGVLLGIVALCDVAAGSAEGTRKDPEEPAKG